MTEATKFSAWAILEVMGHIKLAGLVSEQVIAGQAFVRIDVPDVPGADAFTRFFGASSIYSITPVAEAIAREYAVNLQASPVTIYGDSALARALKQTALPMPERARPARPTAYDEMHDDERPF